MTRIIVNEAAQFGIKGTTKSKPVKSEEYKKLVNEADKMIEENRFQYAHAYKNARNCIARGQIYDHIRG